MNIIDRIILTLYSFFIAALSLLLLLVPISPWAYDWTNYLLHSYRLAWQNMMIPIFFLGVSIRFLISGIKSNKINKNAVIRHTPFGEVKITLQAIETMVQKSAKVVPGLKDIKATALYLEDGLLIKIKAAALSDVNIPESTVKMQQNVKQYIEEYTGISVKEIKVMIDDIATQSKGRVE